MGIGEIMSDIKLLTKTCEYINISKSISGVNTLSSRIAERVLSKNMTDEQLEFVLEVFSEQYTMDYVKGLITPVSKKDFVYEYNNPTEYFPTETPLDDFGLYDGEPHFIYIHSSVQGRYGETYWISDNCSSSLKALPTIKSFKEFDFQIGKFYKVKCVDEIHWGNNKKKYVFEISEISEDEFMENGFICDAYDNGWADYHYVQSQ